MDHVQLKTEPIVLTAVLVTIRIRFIMCVYGLNYESSVCIVDVVPVVCSNNFCIGIAIAISIKIEDSSPPPPSLHQQNVVSTKLPSRPFGHFESNTTARFDDQRIAKPPGISNERPDAKPASVRDFETKGRGSVKSRRCSPEHCSSVDIRSASRSPSQRCQSRSHSSRHSVEIKSERSTPPPVVKKSSSHHRFYFR
jgi:hypothetical protein